MPHCGDEEEERHYSGCQAVNTFRVNNEKLKVERVYGIAHADGGVENRSEAQAAGARVIGKKRGNGRHIQIEDEAEIRKRRAEHAGIRALGDGVASFKNDARDGRPGIAGVRQIKSIGDADKREREHIIWREF